MPSNLQPNDLAAYILDALAQKLPDLKDRQATLARLLGLSPNAVYKKLRGFSALSVGEVALIARHFGISIDAFVLHTHGFVPAAYPPLLGRSVGPRHFMESLRAYVNMARQAPNARLWYATSEIPVFHYFYFRELTAFKLFMWQKVSWQSTPGYVPVNLSALVSDDYIDDLRREIAEGYNHIYSTEFWPRHLLENTLQQLEHMKAISPVEDRKLLEPIAGQLRSLVRHQSAMATTGRKHLPGAADQGNAPFELYYNEIAHTGNTFLLESDAGFQVFTTFDNPNHLVIQNEDFCRRTHQWFGQLARLGNPVSHGSEKNRGAFFQFLEDHLDGRQTGLSS